MLYSLCSQPQPSDRLTALRLRLKAPVNSGGKLRRIFAANISLLLKWADSSHRRNALTYFPGGAYVSAFSCPICDSSLFN